MSCHQTLFDRNFSRVTHAEGGLKRGQASPAQRTRSRVQPVSIRRQTSLGGAESSWTTDPGARQWLRVNQTVAYHGLLVGEEVHGGCSHKTGDWQFSCDYLLQCGSRSARLIRAE